MGIVLFVLDVNCEIPKDRIPIAYQAVKTLQTGTWIRSSAVKDAQTLGELLGAWRWDSGLDEEGNLLLNGFLGEKLGDDDLLFETLGPSVKSGGFITVATDDGRVWRWFFDGQRMIRQRGRIEFE